MKSFLKKTVVFLLLFSFFNSSTAMQDDTKKPNSEAKAPPGCIRQNSDELRKSLLQLATAQGNLGLLKELQKINEKLSKLESAS